MNDKKTVSLSQLCTLNMGQSPSSESYNTEQDGLPFYQGNADFGDIHPCARVWCNNPTKIAEANDILLSVRAPIGALNITKERCCIGRGLAALTPIPEKCSLMYLYYALKSKVKILEQQGTGSTFKAVGKDKVSALQIPIYAIEEQDCISDILTCVDAGIEKAHRQLAELDTLVKSRFIEMFGDPVTNPMGWATARLEELGELNRGVSKHRPRNAPELLDGPYPLVQTGDVANAETYITKYSSTYSEVGLKQSRMWSKGTLCITIAANIAKTGILTFDACFPDSVVGFIAGERTNQLYMHHWFSFFQKILEEQAPQSAQKNINLQILSNLSVMNPPIDLQNQFAAFVEQVDKSKLVLYKLLKKQELLRAALMQEYFG